MIKLMYLMLNKSINTFTFFKENNLTPNVLMVVCLFIYLGYMIEHHSHIGDISIRANLLYKGNLILVHFKGL